MSGRLRELAVFLYLGVLGILYCVNVALRLLIGPTNRASNRAYPK